MVNKLPELMAKLLLDNCENFELWNSLKCMFDLKAKLYQNHMLSEENAILFLKSTVQIDIGDKKWRDDLKVGSLIDCVKIEPMLETKCWGHAIVVKRFENKNNDEPPKVRVSF